MAKGPARVNSIHALREFRAALVLFADEARAALDAAQGELTRASHRMSSDLPRYWQAQQRRWEEETVRAKIALEHARSQADMGKSSVDERKALARAKENAQNARIKLAATKKWTRELERELTLYRGQVEPLARIVEADIPRAIAALDRMGAQLEQYTAVQAPQERHNGASVERTMATAAAGGTSGRASSADRYSALRALRPHADTVRDAPASNEPPELDPIATDKADRRALALVAGGHPPADLRKSVACAIDPDATTLVLQRDEPADDADAGWRIHTDPRPDAWTRVPGVRLLRLLPDLASVARLPEASLVIVEGGAVTALFDTIGNDVWDDARAPADDDEGSA